MQRETSAVEGASEDGLPVLHSGKDGSKRAVTVGLTMPGAGARLMLTVPEVASRLSLGRSTVHAMLKCGVLSSVTVGRLRRIPIDSLEALVSSLHAAPSGAARTE